MISQEKCEHIKTLADADGHIEPADVVADARDPASPLHEEFIWDDTEAATAYRIDQARRLIRFVKLEITVEDRTVRSVAYVVDPDRPAKSRRYVDLTVAATHRSTAQIIMMAEIQRIAAAIQRAQEIAAVLGLSGMLHALLEDVNRLREAAEKKAATKKPKRGRTVPPRRRGGRPEMRA